MWIVAHRDLKRSHAMRVPDPHVRQRRSLFALGWMLHRDTASVRSAEAAAASQYFGAIRFF
jgi:hypothetical protein